MMVTRRNILKASLAGAAVASVPGQLWLRNAYGAPGMYGLSDPALQPKFAIEVPDALAPSFKYQPDKHGRYKVQIRPAVQQTGLRAGPNADGPLLNTPVWGYAEQGKKAVATWPGKTFEVESVSAGGRPHTEVVWANALDKVTQHLLPVDSSLHWCYALHGYERNSISRDGIPIITHLHGGRTDFQFDGNPEFFYSPNGKKQVVGPQWQNVPGGFTTKFRYDNDVPAGNLWYHDHALGITRLNVYAGLAGFYFVRDEFDTGKPDNPLGLPAWPYEKAYAIQDRMFRDNGDLFYSAFPGEPFYDDFIGEDVDLPEDLFPGGGPTALAEFFGDHMLVNGVIWPFEAVEPRNYRMHLLNGTDSRFMVVQFRAVPAGQTDLTGAGQPIPFWVVGSDQGLGDAKQVSTLVFEPGSRYDIVFDFKTLQGQRIIMENLAADAPFGGDISREIPDLFPNSQTDRIMAFDVADVPDVTDGFAPANINGPYVVSGDADRVRKVALFEGMDEFGRLQPLLGTAEPATDYNGNAINWPNKPAYVNAELVGQMEGSIAWHSPTTENPAVGDTEIWEIYNATGDAHPVHLHLVNFQVLDRSEFTANVFDQPVVQHNGLLGQGFRLDNIQVGLSADKGPGDGYVENAPKDMVTALPEQVTRIKMTFDKPGRYVWHCHILSHEDHEMMRVLHVGDGA